MRVLLLAYVLALGLGLGLGSAYWAVQGRPVVGMVRIGPWETWPRSGTRDSDPYMRASLARGVHLPLGAGEGMELIATQDGSGRPLDGRCRYAVSGSIPATRGWTLSVTDTAGEPFANAFPRSQLGDGDVVREEGGALRIEASAMVTAGNWLPLPEAGRFQLRLRLYDTPVSSPAAELREQALPQIARLDCR